MIQRVYHTWSTRGVPRWPPPRLSELGATERPLAKQMKPIRRTSTPNQCSFRDITKDQNHSSTRILAAINLGWPAMNASWWKIVARKMRLKLIQFASWSFVLKKWSWRPSTNPWPWPSTNELWNPLENEMAMPCSKFHRRSHSFTAWMRVVAMAKLDKLQWSAVTWARIALRPARSAGHWHVPNVTVKCWIFIGDWNGLIVIYGG